MGNLVEYVNMGGNLLLASDEYSDPMLDFAIEFSASFESTKIQDPLNSFSDNVIFGKALPINSIVNVKKPVLYSGVSHHLSNKNPLIIPILVGSPTSYTPLSTGGFSSKTNVGSSNVLVSAFQSLKNSRVIFSGSSSLFSDVYLYKSNNIV
jgi:hypothetical protein